MGAKAAVGEESRGTRMDDVRRPEGEKLVYAWKKTGRTAGVSKKPHNGVKNNSKLEMKSTK